MKQNRKINPAKLSQLQSYVAQSNQLLDKLSIVLKNEHTALANHDLDSISELSIEKVKSLKEVEVMRSNMMNLISTPENPAKESELNNIILDTNNNSLKSNWQELTTKLKNCRLQNEKNGRLIGVGQMFSQQLLDILRGVPAHAELYGPAGERENISQGKLLVHA